MIILIFPLLILSLVTLHVDSYITIVNSGSSECFIEQLHKGESLELVYEVFDGTPLEIDFVIIDPKKQIIFKEHKSNNGHHQFEAKLDGTHRICFKNSKSKSDKYVMFDMEAFDEDGPEPEVSSDISKEIDEEILRLKRMTRALSKSVHSSRKETRYLIARDKTHRRINQTSNSGVVWWSTLEIFMTLGVALVQVWYIRRFFEINRKV